MPKPQHTRSSSQCFALRSIGGFDAWRPGVLVDLSRAQAAAATWESAE